MSFVLIINTIHISGLRLGWRGTNCTLKIRKEDKSVVISLTTAHHSAASDGAVWDLAAARVLTNRQADEQTAERAHYFR